MDVSIIIVNYNTKILTENCINSIFNLTEDIKFEIILVDNASTDGSIEFFKTYNNIKFIESKKNIGFGKANNLGYKYAKGKYIFLLNSDTVLLNNAVKIFYENMENLPHEIACIGCQLLSENSETIATSYGNFPEFNEIYKTLYNLYLGRFLGLKKFNIINNTKIVKSIIVDYIIGADLFIRKNIIDNLGLFDDDFFMYYEETEMQLRYKNKGFKSMLISGPQIIHLEPNLKEYSKKRYTTKQRYIYFEGMFLYYKKTTSILKYSMFRFLSLGYLPLIINTKGNVFQKIQLFLLFIGFKTIKH